MTQLKKKPGRPAKIQTKVTAQNYQQPLEKVVPQTGLIPITEEEYNRINGIVVESTIGTPERIAQVLAAPLVKDIEDMSNNKVGTFIVVNTPNIKGVRLNLEKVRTYAKAGQNSFTVQVSWDNGTSSAYDFGTEHAAEEFLALLDSYCL